LDDEHWPTTDDQWELVFKAIIAEKFPPPNDELENLKRTIAKEISVWRTNTQRARAYYAERTVKTTVALLDARARSDRHLRTHLENYRLLQTFFKARNPDREADAD